MSQIDQMLAFNQEFVEQKEYVKYTVDHHTDRKVAIVTCMDARLIELLPKATNLRNGEAKFIKTAGAILTHPFGGAMRSVIIAVCELGAKEVCVIGHHDCKMQNVDPTSIIQKMEQQGIKKEVVSVLENAGIDLKTWLRGFECVEDGIQKSVELIRNHPLLPKHVLVHGMIIDPETGKLDLIIDGRK